MWRTDNNKRIKTMAQLRSYTTISQSKKLAEFLPNYSADMGWYYSQDPNAARDMMWCGTKAEGADIPSWTLSALLAILPVNIEYKGESHRLRLDLGEKDFNIWYDNTDIGGASDIDVLADNPIDACYEMIIKLKEQNLL